jgi:hypothetical protein
MVSPGWRHTATTQGLALEAKPTPPEARICIMSDAERDARIGKATRECKEAQDQLDLLVAEARGIGEALYGLGFALGESEVHELVVSAREVLDELERNKFDFSQITLESLRRLIVAIEETESKKERVAEELSKLLD